MADELSWDDAMQPEEPVEPAPAAAPAWPSPPQAPVQELSFEDASRPEKEYGALETFGAHAARSAPATVGGLGTGLAVGAGVSAVASPFVGVPAGIVAGLGGGWLIDAGVDKVMAALGWDKPLKEMAEQNPWSAVAGDIVPQAALLRPNLRSLSVAERAIGAGVGGAFEGGSQLMQGEFDARRLAANVAAGAVLTRTNRAGAAFERAGTRAGVQYKHGDAGPEALDFYEAGRRDTPIDAAKPEGPETRPPADEIEVADIANDVTITARGVAAENPPAPQFADIGNPDTGPGAHVAKGGDTSYIKDAPDRIETGLTDGPVVNRGDVQPDIELAVLDRPATGADVPPAPVETGLTRRPNPMEADEDALLRMSRMQREAENARHPEQGIDADADVPPGPHVDRRPEPPAGARPENRPEREISFEEAARPPENIPSGKPAEAEAPLTPDDIRTLVETKKQLQEAGGWDRFLDRMNTLSPRAQVSALKLAEKELGNAKGRVTEQSAEGETVTKQKPQGYDKETKRWFLSNGATAKGRPDYERKQGELDTFKKLYDEWGPNSEQGKGVDVLDPEKASDARDYFKRFLAEATHAFGGRDPNGRDIYKSTAKGHPDTHIIEWMRAARDYARTGKSQKIANLHREGITAEDGKLAADTRNIEIEAQHRKLDEPDFEARAADVAQQSGDVEARHTFEPFSDPDGMESKVYARQQNELRQWLNDLEDVDYRLLEGKQPDLKTDVATTQDPADLLSIYKNDLEQAQMKRPGVMEHPAETDPAPLVKKVEAPVAETPAPAGRTLDKNSEEFKRLAAAYSQDANSGPVLTKAQQLERIAAREESLTATVTRDEGTHRERSLFDTAKSFLDDESGAGLMPQQMYQQLQNWLASRKPANVTTPTPKEQAKMRSAIETIQKLREQSQVYADSLTDGFKKFNRRVEQHLIDYDKDMRGAIEAHKAAGFTARDERKIYQAMESRDFSKLTPSQRTFFDTHIKPMWDDVRKQTQDFKDINDRLKLGFRIPDLNLATVSDHVTRVKVDKPGDDLGMSFDPITGRGLSAVSPNILEREHFALVNKMDPTDRLVIQNDPNKDTFKIIRRNQPDLTIPKPPGFTGDLTQLIGLKRKGQTQMYEVDHARASEIEHATKRATRYHESPILALTAARRSISRALEEAKLFESIRTDPRWADNMTTDKKVAQERGYSIAPTTLPAFAYDGPMKTPVYLPQNVKWAFDNFNGHGTTNEIISGLRSLSTEFAKIFNLNAPLIHVMNEANRFIVGRGGKWLDPKSNYGLLSNLGKAIKSVHQQDALQTEMRANGLEPLWASTYLQNTMDAAKKSLGLEIVKNPSKYDPIFKLWGTTAKDFYEKWYRGTSHATWYPVDILTTLRYMEEKAAGWSPAEAAQRVNKWGADYSLDPTIISKGLAGRRAQQFVTDPMFTLFGRWKASLLRSMANTTKDAFKGDPMLRAKAQSQNFGHAMVEVKARQEALGQLITLALVSYGLGEAARAGYGAITGDKDTKPWTIDRGLEAATGVQGIEMRPRGASALVSKAAEIPTGGKGFGDVAANLWSAAPHLQVAIDVARNKDWRGKEIIPSGKWPGVIPDAIGGATEYAARTAFPIYGSVSRGYSRKEGSVGTGIRDLALEQIGVSTKSEASQRFENQREKRQWQQQKQRDKTSGGIIPDIVRSPWR